MDKLTGSDNQNSLVGLEQISEENLINSQTNSFDEEEQYFSYDIIPLIRTEPNSIKLNQAKSLISIKTIPGESQGFLLATLRQIFCFFRRLYKQCVSNINNERSIEILEKHNLWYRSTKDIRSGWLDAPHAGDKFDGKSIPVVGWILGQKIQPIAIKILVENTPIVEIPISVPRPDVMKVHFLTPPVYNSGFKGLINIENVPNTSKIYLHAIFSDSYTVPIFSFRIQKYGFTKVRRRLTSILD